MIKVAIAIVLASVVIGLGALAAAFIVRNDSQNKARALASANAAVARAACIAEHKDTQTLNNLLVYIEGRTLQNPQLTSAERAAITQFYAGLIKTLPDITKPC